MYTIVIDEAIRCRLDEQFSNDILQTFFSELTFDNPVYQRALKMGYQARSLEPTINLWEIRGSELILPRGYGKRFQSIIRDLGKNFKDHRMDLSSVEFQSKISLRPYQQKAVQRLIEQKQGGYVAPCGSGKTIVGLETVALAGQPALVIVHTKELAHQWRDQAITYLGLSQNEIGMVGDGKMTVGGRLTIGLVQTLAKVDLNALRGKFGLVLLDEAHHVPAKTFHKVFGAFPARYRLWLSATPGRADGLESMLYAVGGPILYAAKQKDTPIVYPCVIVSETQATPTIADYAGTLTSLVKDKDRNRLIVETIGRYAKRHYTLVLSDRVVHLNTLLRMIRESLPGMKVEVLHGQLSKRERETVMARMQAKEIDILVATIQLAKEGLDLPHLDRVALATPIRSDSTVKQVLGRVMRPVKGGKSPLVLDFWDRECVLVRSQFLARQKTYRSLHAKIYFNEKKTGKMLPQSGTLPHTNDSQLLG
ncbi:DEAD/DEAH box helicase [Alicyclobacillaceae bacterium I2511]|nr:DEAD/DEAH box helicase [Alicyclobacillaceae bacterium I2511]